MYTPRGGLPSWLFIAAVPQASHICNDEHIRTSSPTLVHIIESEFVLNLFGVREMDGLRGAISDSVVMLGLVRVISLKGLR